MGLLNLVHFFPFKVNLLLQRDEDFPPLSKLPFNDTYALPVFWVQEGFEAPPALQQGLLVLVLALPSIVASGLPVLLLLVGVLVLVRPAWRLFKKVLCKRKKNGDGVLGSGDLGRYDRVPMTERQGTDNSV